MNKFIKIIFTLAVAGICLSCDKFLDIVPDDVPVMDHALSSAIEAEKYLATCYSFINGSGDPKYNIGMTAGDEMWLHKEWDQIHAPAWYSIALGERNPDNSTPDLWAGVHSNPRYKAIRICNDFITDISNESNVPDLTKDKRIRWVAEVKCLKALYHFELLRYYGPIPIVDKNLPVWASPEEVKVYRQPFDDCVEYISDLLDECLDDLPLAISNRQSELGRMTKPINRALKARLLLLAASPLFNGNTDYYDFADSRGVKLFPQEYDENKWELAAKAALEAIQVAESAGHELYYFQEPTAVTLSEVSKIQLNTRMALCARINNEAIWAPTGQSGIAGNDLQAGCMALLDNKINGGYVRGQMGPPMAIVEQFYTRNGVPISEDKYLDFSKGNKLMPATTGDMYNIETGFVTARINFDRENRFYSALGFDGGKWLMENHPSRTDFGTYTLYGKAGGYASVGGASKTGYFSKKVVNWKSDFNSEGGTGAYQYAFPEIRLAEMYLAYAEALNEFSGPSDDVYDYLDRIRKRAGLEGVKSSWNKYSNNPSKYKTKEGLREIIRQERMIELCLEGHRYWDILRWKLGHKYFNAPIVGWDVTQKDTEPYYQYVVIYSRKFVSPRDYLAPIPNSEIIVNRNIVQNPGW